MTPARNTSSGCDLVDPAQTNAAYSRQIRPEPLQPRLTHLYLCLLMALLQGALTSIVSPAAQAQTSAQIKQDQGQRVLDERRQEATRQRALTTKGGMEIKVDPVKKPGKEPRCLPIKAVNVTGITLIGQEEISKILSTLLSDCMGPKGIDALMGAINKIYIDRGYITTRTFIPKQDLSSGKLELVVVEGRVGDIEYVEILNGKPKPGPHSKLTTSFPGIKGKFLQLRDIEQGLDQINRLPSSTATLDIKPGKKPGESILVIKNKRKNRLRAFAKFNYTGFKNGDLRRADVVLEADDLLQLNDNWYLAYSGSESSNSLSFSSSLPYGRWLHSLSLSYSDSLSLLTSTSDLFNQSASVTGSTDYLMFRDAKRKWKIGAALTHRWNARYINSISLTPQSLSVAGLTTSYEHHFPGMYLSLTGGVDVGVPLFGADKNSNAKGAAQSKFSKIKGSATVYKGFNNGLTVYSVATGQLSRQILYSTDQFYIGGSGSVRGFEAYQRSGELGVSLQNTLNLPLYALTGGTKKFNKIFGKAASALLSLTPYVFVDGGRVHSLANDTSLYMVSGGAGLKLSTERVTGDIFIAKPIGDSREINARGFGVKLSLSVRLY